MENNKVVVSYEVNRETGKCEIRIEGAGDEVLYGLHQLVGNVANCLKVPPLKLVTDIGMSLMAEKMLADVYEEGCGDEECEICSNKDKYNIANDPFDGLFQSINKRDED